MGMDLSMVQSPDPGDIPNHYPQMIRECPGYFRGVPSDHLEEAGILHHSTNCPDFPDWPPEGLTVGRAEQIRDFFDSPFMRYYSRESDLASSLLELGPSPRELRIMQRYLDRKNRALSMGSRYPGKVPAFKFDSNDGWHVIPAECLVIAYRLSIYLEKKLAQDRGTVDGSRQRMRLKFPHAEAVEEPTPEQVVEAVRRLDRKAEDPFFILEDESEPHAFMQTEKTSARLFAVEYSEGEPQCQYRAEKVTARIVVELFTAYLRRDATFKTAVPWADITEKVFGDYYRDLQWLREFIAFNELAARYGGYEVW